MKFFFDRLRNKKTTRAPRVTVANSEGIPRERANFEEAFGFSGYEHRHGLVDANGMQLRGSSDENIRLAPYAYSIPDGVTPTNTITSEGTGEPEAGPGDTRTHMYAAGPGQRRFREPTEVV